MANIKSKLKAPKTAAKNKHKKKNLSTGKTRKESNKATKSPRNVKLMTQVVSQSFLLNTDITEDTQLSFTNRSARKHSPSLTKGSSVAKSGRIKKIKNNFELIDNILKSELMIDDKIKPKKRLSNGIKKQNEKNKKKSNGKGVNNNDKTICDKNKNRFLDVSNSVVKVKPDKIKRSSKKKDPNAKVFRPKQVTIRNGLVITFSLFECDYCQKTFNNKSSLQRHIITHLGLKPWPCSKCPKRFREHCSLKAHFNTKHSSCDEPQSVFVCDQCNKSFLIKENLISHIDNHDNDKDLYKCTFCSKSFSYHMLLMQHEKQHLVSGPFKCSICNKNFSCRSRLSFHITSHLKIKNFVCQFCGKEFLRANSIKRHVEVCHVGFRIQCPICHKKLKGHLSEHMRTHEKKRPHECPDCGKCFTQSTQLTVHRRSHTGSRPYPCRICGRPFSHSNALMLHIRRHTGEKPFACAMCPLSFSQLPHMKAHMRKIHGKDNPYKCEKCKQFFKWKIHLEAHVKTCTVGDRELSFEEKIQACVRHEEMEVESAMSLSRMRFLLALLLTMIATKDRLKYLGFNKRLIDDLLIESLEAMGHTPCKDDTLSPLKRLKLNIEMMLKGTVPIEQMDKLRKENKTTEEILELLTDEKKHE